MLAGHTIDSFPLRALLEIFAELAFGLFGSAVDSLLLFGVTCRCFNLDSFCPSPDYLSTRQTRSEFTCLQKHVLMRRKPSPFLSDSAKQELGLQNSSQLTQLGFIPSRFSHFVDYQDNRSNILKALCSSEKVRELSAQCPSPGFGYQLRAPLLSRYPYEKGFTVLKGEDIEKYMKRVEEKGSGEFVAKEKVVEPLD